MMLAALQHDFRSWLASTPHAAADRLDPRALAGLAVYQNNYRAQLLGCLEEAFPQVRAWLGDDAFLHATHTHVNRHPPHAWTLDAYAGDFGATLSERYPNNPDLHELAWIENALGEAFVAGDAQALPLETLAAIDWDSARLHLTPSLLNRAATTNAEQIWSALREGREIPEGEMLAEPGGLIVWRRGFICCLQQVDALEFEALLRVQQDGRFAALCDWLVARLGDEQGVDKAGTLLAGWLSNELVTGAE
jgi:hypothetical protein